MTDTFGCETVSVIIDGDAPVLVATYPSLESAVLSGDSGDEGDRTGVMLWAGAHAMCSYIVKHKDEWSKCNVVELGIGSGLTTSLVARYAVKTVGTDGADGALLLAKESLRLNGVTSKVVLMVFNWCTMMLRDVVPLALSDTLPCVIMAAEIVYPSTPQAALVALFENVRDLIKTWAAAATSNKFIMSYVQRNPDTTLLMLKTAWDSGFHWESPPWHLYASTKPPLDACIIEFSLHGNTDIPVESDFPDHVSRTFSSLFEDIARLHTARREAEEEAGAFMLPSPFDDQIDT